MKILFIVAVIVTIAMVGFALLAHASLPKTKQIPMQWSLRGEINWTAPRAFGLGFFPLLGFTCMVAYILLMEYAGPRPGQENLVIPVMIILGAVLFTIQIIHAYMASKSLRDQ